MIAANRLLILLAGVLLLAACDRADPKEGLSQPKDQLIVPKDPQSVTAATQQARANLPIFWTAFDAAPSKEDFVVKVGMPTRGGGVEHIWIDVAGRDGDKISGTLANEPDDLPGLKLGSRVTVKTSQVSDWAYPKNGKFYGHFTTRVMMSQMEPDTQAKTQAMLWPTALEEPAK